MILLLPLLLSFILYVLNEKGEYTILYTTLIIILYNILISIGINLIKIYILLILIYWLINEENNLYSIIYLISTLLIFYSNSLYSIFISIELISLLMVTYINLYIQNRYFGILYYLFSSIFTALFILALGYLYIGVNIAYYLIILIFIYKLGLPPFHILIPKIYGNLSIKKVIFLDILNKYLILHILYRLLITTSINLHPILGVSIILGTLLSLNEFNLLNIYIYSSTVNYSFLLILINNYTLFYLYLFNYILMSLLFLYLISYLYLHYSVEGGYYLFLWLILFLNLIGIPPLIGFWIKFYLLYILLLNLNYSLLILILTSLLLLSFVYIRLFLNYYINTNKISISSIINKDNFNSHIISSITTLLLFPIFFI